jgi:lysyl-tRNA synthetase class 2
LELANAFTELNDPDEQRRRFEVDRKIKQNGEGYTGGVDEALLAALEHGMPPAGGIALGLDRLMMILADVPTIDPVISFRDY